MSEGYRQSALLLHGLGKADRQWIMAQLPDEQRQALASQLVELEELGIPSDRTLTESLLVEARKRTATAPARAFGSALRQASAASVLPLLSGQPTWLVATVLCIEAWPWREAIYTGLDASRRERVKQSMGARPPEKLARALVSQLEARLDTAEAVTAAPSNEGSGWSRFLRKFQKRQPA